MSWLVASPFGLCLPHAACCPACAAHLVTYFNVYLSESASRIQQPATRTRATPPTKPTPHTAPACPTATSSSVEALVRCVCVSVCVLQGMPAVSLRCRGGGRGALVAARD